MLLGFSGIITSDAASRAKKPSGGSTSAGELWETNPAGDLKGRPQIQRYCRILLYSIVREKNLLTALKPKPGSKQHALCIKKLALGSATDQGMEGVSGSEVLKPNSCSAQRQHPTHAAPAQCPKRKEAGLQRAWVRKETPPPKKKKKTEKIKEPSQNRPQETARCG